MSVTINLEKGQRINLEKQAPGIKELLVGVGWREGVFDGDICALMLDENERVVSAGDIVYYGTKDSGCGSLKLDKDNTTGAGDGDDEVISVNLSTIPDRVKTIRFAVSLHKAEERGHKFGMVEDCYVRIVNKESNEAIARHDLTEDFSTCTVVEVADFYTKEGTWRVKSEPKGHSSFVDFLGRHGVTV